MNAKQKKFILEKLIPFVLREQGRGFAMEVWEEHPAGKVFLADGIDREIPKCGTICCIGGSCDVLMKNRNAPKVLGLSPAQADTLFYGDDADNFKQSGGNWPSAYQKRFAEARTTYRKAQVACSLLREVVKTNGKCLDGN